MPVTNDLVSELLVRWVELRQQGRIVSAEELCRDRPDLLDAVRSRMAALESVGRLFHTSAPSMSDTSGQVRSSSDTFGRIKPGDETVPGYILVERIGKGGFGEVWTARGPSGFRVALKFVPCGGVVGKAETRSLNIIKELRHPNLVSVFGAWRKDDLIVIAMELAERSVWDRFLEVVAAGLPGIPRSELFEYMRQAALALDYLNAPRHRLGGAQDAGVQHRDIKPQNLLLSGGGVKVADLGLARLVRDGETSHTGNLTVAYAAPEFFEGRTTRWSDQYSLGVTYCLLRGGRPPFTGDLAEVMAGHLHRPPDLTMVPEEERAAVAKALAKVPEQRWPMCLDFVESLIRNSFSCAKGKKASATSTGRVNSEFRSPPVAIPMGKTCVPSGQGQSTLAPELPPRRHRIKWAVLGGVMSLLIVAAIAWGIRSHLLSSEPNKETISPGLLSSERHSAEGRLTGGEEIEVEIGRGVKMPFCWIPPGRAMLGSPSTEKGRNNDEMEHEYTCQGLWLAKYPVTQEQWQTLMGNNPSYFKETQNDIKNANITDTSRFPVEQVCWDDDKNKEYSVREYLKKMNASAKVPATMGQGKFVLPHEDEWEYACRGGKGNKQAFYFGDRLNGDLANCNGNFPFGTDTKGEWKQRTTEVGEYEKVAPHPWGLCDMHGNVWQWCDNKYKNDENSRVVRGGCWFHGAGSCRSARRDRSVPGQRNGDCGFRPCFRLH
jgi:formylglycine-generating enzyme required for sulfatase activity